MILRRTTNAAKRAKARTAVRFERNFGGVDRVKAVSRLPCAAHGAGCRSARRVNAHVRSRGMGGAGGGARDVIPLCDEAHREMDEGLGRRRFSEKYGLDLSSVAEETARRVDEIVTTAEVQDWAPQEEGDDDANDNKC